MPTESAAGAELRIDDFVSSEDLSRAVGHLEAEQRSFIQVHVAFESLPRAQEALLSLRAANISALLLVQRPVGPPQLAEARDAITRLRDWDQLLLENVIRICERWIPEEPRATLASEARHELKWFSEWIGASGDPRLLKFPGLPWRSFVRKTVAENFAFASGLLDAEESQPSPEAIAGFLDRKKQAVCLFPKRWRRDGESTH